MAAVAAKVRSITMQQSGSGNDEDDDNDDENDNDDDYDDDYDNQQMEARRCCCLQLQ